MPVQRPYNPNAKRIAELMQADLAKIGVKAEIKSFEWGEYRKRLQAGEHQMGMLGWTGDNGDPDNFLHTLLGCNSAKSAPARTLRSSATSRSTISSPRRRRCRSRPSAPSSMSRRR